MIITFHKSSYKQAVKLKPAQKERLKKALVLFQNAPNHPDLYNHPLTGEWVGHRSIALGGDWRAHYIAKDDSVVLFVAVGTHSQLYD